MRKVLSWLGCAAVLGSGALHGQLPFQVSGNITSGPQYDLYTVDLPANSLITATLVCDFDGVSRPLDPVLSIFLPGSDPSDTANADYYNDDGFGTDDDPAGVDCDAFDSSRIIFTNGPAVQVTVRADGFGSATGPYTLAIGGQPVLQAIPTVGTVGLVVLAAGLAVAAAFALRRRRAT